MTSPITNIYGDQIWLNAIGEYHRTDGPAVIYAEDKQWWYVNDRRIRSNKGFQEAANLSDEEMTMIILKYGDVT